MWERVMSHVGMSRVTCGNVSCHMCEWVMSHVRTSHVTCGNESCRRNASCQTWEQVMSHVGMSHVTRIEISHVTRVNESCHTCQWVMTHVGTSHVARGNESCHTHRNESCHTCEWVLSWVTAILGARATNLYSWREGHEFIFLARGPRIYIRVCLCIYICTFLWKHTRKVPEGGTSRKRSSRDAYAYLSEYTHCICMFQWVQTFNSISKWVQTFKSTWRRHFSKEER